MVRERLVPIVVAIALGVAAVGLLAELVPQHRKNPPQHPTTPRVSGRANLAWPAPSLHDPQTIQITSSTANLRLDPKRDYILRLPRGKPLQVPHGLVIAGGHDVVMVGGSINVTEKSAGALLERQTGTIHLEGIRINGPHLSEGIDLSEPDGATVELENLTVGLVHGSRTTNHADVIQSWAGPRRLLIDGLSGSTQYQGLFLLPNQHYDGPPPKLFDLRNVYINDPHGGYALWLQSTPRVPLRLSHIFVTPNAAKSWRGWWLWPKPAAGQHMWDAVTATSSPPASISKQTASAGADYRS